MDLLLDLLSLFDVGRGLVLLAVLFLIAAYLFRAQKEKILIAGVAVILAILVATVLKELIPIARPCVDSLLCPSGNSFPSRHAAMFFALALALQKTRAFLPYTLIAGFVVFLKVGANQHTIFDIFGGVAVALVCVVVATKIVKFLDSNSYMSLLKQKLKR